MVGNALVEPKGNVDAAKLGICVIWRPCHMLRMRGCESVVARRHSSGGVTSMNDGNQGDAGRAAR